MAVLTPRAMQIGAAFVLGVFVTLGMQYTEPTIGRTLFGTEFQQAYVDCALSQQHADLYRALKLGDALEHEVEKTLEVEALRCVDYATLKLRLKSFRVDDGEIAAMELSAFNAEPQLRCGNRCAQVGAKVGIR